MGTVLVGIDGSKEARLALDWALKQARLRGDTLRLVHVAPHMSIPTYVTGRAGGEPGPSREIRVEAGDRVLDDMLRAARVPKDVAVTTEVLLDDNPAGALIARAADADLLVIGSRGLSGFRGLLLGSVSQLCVTHAPCPVVVVPPRERH